jgi:hypothetical protein
MNRLIAVFLLLALSLVLSQNGLQQPMTPGQMMGQMMPGQGMMGQGMMGAMIEPRMMGQGMMVTLLHDKVAELLGVTSDELFSLRQGGKTLAEIVVELGGTLENISPQLVQQRNDNIDQALAHGTINQLQAQRMKARSEAVITAMLNRAVGVGFANSRMNMMGMMPCPYHSQMMFGPAWNR